MKTILVAHSRPDIVSGAELAIGDVVKKADRHLRFIMLTPGEGALASYYRRQGFEVISRVIQTKRRLYPGLHYVQSVYNARVFRKLGVDAVICNTFAAAARVATTCKIAGIPYAMYVREYIRNIQLHRSMLQKATLVFAVSEDMAEYLGDFVNSGKVFVAHDHIDIAPLLQRIERHSRNASQILPFNSAHPVVGYVGRLQPYKQPDLFVQMIPLVIAKNPEARFVIVGGAQPVLREYEQGLKKLAMELGVEDKVVFMGHREDAIEIVAELRILCLTSDREPFARTLLEAQAAGCPVVAANSGGCLDVVQNESTGLLFGSTGPDAATELAAQVVRLLRDSGLASKLSEQARNRVQEREGSLEPIKNLEHLIDRLLETCKS